VACFVENMGPSTLLLFFVFITTLSTGQSKTIINSKERELIKNEFLTSLYREMKIDFQKIDQTELPIPYFIGDEFVLAKPLEVWEINADSTISFDLNNGSVIPGGYKLRLLSKEGLLYFIRSKDQNGNEDRTKVIDETSLKLYFDPNYETRKSPFFDNYKITIDNLSKRLGKKYKLTPDEVIGIVDSYAAFNKK
jgi:hypothetical protein